MESKVSLKERITAIFAVILVLASLVAFSFAVPWTTVHATSIADQMEDYIDSYFGEGSAFVVEEILDEVADTGGISGKGVYWGVMFALNAIESPESTIVPVDSMTTLSGYYYNGGVKHYCVTPICSDESYTNSAGGVVIAASDQFTLRSLITCNTDITTRQASASTAQGYLYGAFSVSALWANDRRYTQDVTGGGQVFNDYVSPANGWQVRYGVSNNNIPVWGNGTSVFEAVGFSNAGTSIAAYFDPYTSRVNWSDFGISEDIDLSDPSDWVVNYFNEWFIQEYPDDTEIMFIPTEDPTDTTGDSGGCHCQVYVYVTEYFDPEINVYVTEYITVTNNVDVDLELPSEWLQDYTFATDPTELPVPEFPTDPLTTEPVTAPSIDESELQQYEQEFGDGIRFWLWLTGEFVEKLGLQTICGFVFVIAVAGFVLWKAGGSGGGKDD